MNLFTFDVKKIMVILLLIAVPLLTVNVQYDPARPKWYTSPFGFSSSVIQKIYSNFSDEITSTTSLYLDLINIKIINEDLRQKNNELQTQLNLFEELRIENDRLKSLLNFKDSHPLELTLAKVIAHDILSDHSTITINKGIADGIKPMQAVVTPEGVVGYIFRPEMYTSLILLITDRYAVIDAMVQRTRARGIVEGKNKHESQLSYLERTEDIAIGDLIVTSGIDDSFPKGFPIGTIIETEKKNHEASLKATIKPLIASDKLEEVFIITKNNLPPDIDIFPTPTPLPNPSDNSSDVTQNPTSSPTVTARENPPSNLNTTMPSPQPTNTPLATPKPNLPQPTEGPIPSEVTE